MKRTRKSRDYVICIRNTGFKASLIPRRVYEAIEDAAAQQRGLVRVVDESGEDYLFPEALFMSIPLTAPIARAIAKAG